ncbi:Uncharacterised protein [Bordetella ansorpii]|uniref:Uncharacterized protein n=1 Tax=Bordetella ansorpii TaxID=288768 RepID=A0A157SX05_9BORD|nr:hypothetical protein [Bordetella ansorpii]SAI74593.1 Uncharacterised protein [Bordetella ansorpii]
MPDFDISVAMVNPSELASVDELRRALHTANGALLQATLASAALQRAGLELSDMLAEILIAHIRGDADGVRRHIEAAIERTRFAPSDADRQSVH